MSELEIEMIELHDVRLDVGVCDSMNEGFLTQSGCNGLGCIYTFKGKRYLLTVAHLIPDLPEYKLAVNGYWDEENHKVVYYVMQFTLMKSFSIGKDKSFKHFVTPAEADIHELAYAELADEYRIYNMRINAQGQIYNNAEIQSFSDIRKPKFSTMDNEEIYYVGGVVGYQQEMGTENMTGDFVYYCCRLDKVDDEYNRYRFEIINCDDYDVEDLGGLSGAPIFDGNGNLISIVSSGVGKSFLYGLDLEVCLLPLHMGL